MLKPIVRVNLRSHLCNTMNTLSSFMITFGTQPRFPEMPPRMLRQSRWKLNGSQTIAEQDDDDATVFDATNLEPKCVRGS